MENRTYFSLILFTVFLAGCSVITPVSGPAIDVYTLSPVTGLDKAISATNQPDALTLALSPIRSSRGFMGTDIIYRDSDHSYNSYMYSRWDDSPTNLLALFFQQSLEQSEHIAAVIALGSISKADLLLESTLLDFSHHLQNGKQSTGVVIIKFYLIDPKTKAVLATKEFSAEFSADPINAKGAASAINQASSKVAQELRIWLGAQISQLAEK